MPQFVKETNGLLSIRVISSRIAALAPPATPPTITNLSGFSVMITSTANAGSLKIDTAIYHTLLQVFSPSVACRRLVWLPIELPWCNSVLRFSKQSCENIREPAISSCWLSSFFSDGEEYVISRDDLFLTARGFLMGGADIIPGISGGTVALIIGIYDRLVTAISHFDLHLLGLLSKRQWKAAAEYIDLQFLISLGIGVVLGIGGLATLMHYLLERQMQYTFAAFFGLILASSILVGHSVKLWSAGNIIAAVIGAVIAFIVVGLPILQQPPSGLIYLFGCGMIAICAMILPGISGAFILLLLGEYHEITGMLKDLLKGNITQTALMKLTVFCSGCLIGLISFSKLLRWLLKHHEPMTMAVLCGIMVGSLRKIWPFKIDLTPEQTEFKLKQFANVLPESIDTAVLLSVGIAVSAFLAILFLDRMTSAHEQIAKLPEQV